MESDETSFELLSHGLDIAHIHLNPDNLEEMASVVQGKAQVPGK